MRRSAALLAACLAVLALGAPMAGAGRPTAHAAATCADYGSQQAAQNAADTRDGDHDGIYCEDDPCPCSAAWHRQHGGGTTPSSGPAGGRAPRLRLGHSVAFRRHLRTRGCRLRGHRRLPDRRCSPGAYYSRATRREICRSGYAERVRDVPWARKLAVYRAYGIRHHRRGAYEMDHIVPLELGGSNARANLFPEPAPGFHRKDRLEDWAHERVCAGARGLRSTQRRIARDWLALYRLAFGR